MMNFTADLYIPISIEVVRNQPLIKGWIRICPNLAKEIDNGNIVNILLFSNFYQLTVTDEIDPIVVDLLRYIGVVVDSESNIKASILLSHDKK
jgi:hypothetical protein